MTVPSPPRLFVFDVDGTLLGSDLEILESTRQAVRELRDAGHHVALASARPPRSVAELSMDLLGEVADAISLNGAYVTSGREVLSEQRIPPKGTAALIENARSQGLEINLFSGWEWLVEEIGPGIEAEREIVQFQPTVVGDLVAAANEGAHKILLIGPPNAVGGFQEWANAAGLRATATRSKTTYCEVVSNQVSKSSALLFLADRIGVPVERVVAFGDGENDLPMIVAAGTGVAMGNAMPEVRAAADLVTSSHDEHGIANALKRLGYLREVG